MREQGDRGDRWWGKQMGWHMNGWMGVICVYECRSRGAPASPPSNMSEGDVPRRKGIHCLMPQSARHKGVPSTPVRGVRGV